MTANPDLDSEIEEIERQLRIARNKGRARDYELKNEWTDALRLYAEVLKDDSEDEEALAGVQRMKESLLTPLYAQGMKQFKAEEWKAAVATFDQLLNEAEKADMADYQDARARRQEAQDHVMPPKQPWPILTWAIAGMGVVIVALIAVPILILRSCLTPPPDTPTPTITPTETPTPPPGGPTDTPTPTITPTETPTLTPTPRTEPQSSPTGKIAVPVFDTTAGVYNVYIARAEDGWQPKHFFENGSQPAFSPDGQQIILRSWRQAADGGYGQRLVLFPSLSTDTGDVRRMTHNMEDAHPSLNSRRGEIVFHSRRKGPQPVLFKLGTWEGAEKDTANQAELVPGENPDWLGNRIVYYAYDPPGLYVMNANGSDAELILEEGSPVLSAAPDNDHVAMSLQREGYWHVFVLSVSQGKSSLTQLTHESANDQLPAWSPDGQFIAFVSNREGKWAVWVMNTDGTNQRKLFDLNGPIDGTVFGALDQSRGWVEERLSWAP